MGLWFEGVGLLEVLYEYLVLVVLGLGLGLIKIFGEDSWVGKILNGVWQGLE